MNFRIHCQEIGVQVSCSTDYLTATIIRKISSADAAIVFKWGARNSVLSSVEHWELDELSVVTTDITVDGGSISTLGSQVKDWDGKGVAIVRTETIIFWAALLVFTNRFDRRGCRLLGWAL
jgi:hypothetical protein